MTIADAKARLSIPEIWTKLELPGEPGGSCRSPFREDNRPSFSIYDAGCRYHDHAEGKGGDAIDFLHRATGLSKPAACRKFIEMAETLPTTTTLLPRPSAAAPLSRSTTGYRSTEKPLERVWNLPKFVPDLDTAKQRWLLDGLAARRHLSGESVRLAHQRGLLEFCFLNVPGYVDMIEWIPAGRDPAWTVLDQTDYNVQMRFLYGDRFGREADSPKAKTWPGSHAKWPIGIHEALAFPLIVLVEGGPDLLAAHHFAIEAGVANDVGVVAMMGAGMKIHPEALPLFAGKRVRIIPDADAPGQRASGDWSDQLRTVGAEVDAFDLAGLLKTNGQPIKDLNDCCKIRAEDQAQLEGLFTL